MTTIGVTREKNLSQLPLPVFGHVGGCRQGRNNLTSLSSTYAAYSEDPGFKYCLRESGSP